MEIHTIVENITWFFALSGIIAWAEYIRNRILDKREREWQAHLDKNRANDVLKQKDKEQQGYLDRHQKKVNKHNKTSPLE